MIMIASLTVAFPEISLKMQDVKFYMRETKLYIFRNEQQIFTKIVPDLTGRNPVIENCAMLKKNVTERWRIKNA